ncbi:glyoxylase-like metal-dependent hydrolase (beta-lactamase superfamily II) [Brevundimonas alba]|uniref:Glyoxylase-like metal-dependent hydrolase (Beta-lactamase superfamily II) n=1 Tax=Brevundimonas alba TaxID=74314 RepID=A0A7X6BMH8_9CAUL|nr:MBL fold metallo-hydrolase [Brevundimonas alba]NJC39994.1 glyoxylase-like metal-dependent hydrolase (beta-lactamase superfamily II) [Brevundimonas alba]
MADGVAMMDEAVKAREERRLTYPFGEPPASGQAVTVAPGVLWMRLAMPIALNHINVYAVREGEGWVLIDTGLDLAATRDEWDTLLSGPLGGMPVTRVICTHMHPDHIGLAGWLCGRFAAPLLMTRLEYVTARMLLADTGQPAPEDGAVFYRAAGWDGAQVEGYRTGYGQFGRVVSPMPSGFVRMREGDRLSIGGDDWRVVVGEGHSPEHACLWRESDGVVLGGDQILPKISSNVSVWPTEPDADPLGDWLESLERMKSVFPNDVLVLPSHGEPFRGVQARLDALIRGHLTALRRLERTLRKPCRAVDVFSALFARPVGDGVRGMATGESLAHLNYLFRRGRAARSRDADGVDWWTAIKQGSKA